MPNKRKPQHVGVFFKRRFINENDALNMSNTAKFLGVSRQHLNNLCKGSVPCSPEMAARLAIATDTNVAFWLNMQANYDAWEAEFLMSNLDVQVFSEHVA